MINYDYMFEDKKEDYTKILEEIRSDKAQLVDIREQNEWEQSRFQCAIHVPLSGLAKGIGVDILKKIKQENKKIYLHCRSGNRVRMAEKVLAQYGCTDFSIIPASMMEMIEKGFVLTQ
jgi:rhodanese-related sulfurtransferase